MFNFSKLQIPPPHPPPTKKNGGKNAHTKHNQQFNISKLQNFKCSKYSNSIFSNLHNIIISTIQKSTKTNHNFEKEKQNTKIHNFKISKNTSTTLFLVFDYMLLFSKKQVCFPVLFFVISVFVRQKTN